MLPFIPDSLDPPGTQCPCLVPEDSHSRPWEGGRHIRRRQPEKWVCVERKTVGSKYLQNCLGRRITLWGCEGQKEDRWGEIRLESRFPLPGSTFWQTRLPEERPPQEERVLQSQRLDRSWGHHRSLLQGPVSG